MLSMAGHRAIKSCNSSIIKKEVISLFLRMTTQRVAGGGPEKYDTAVQVKDRTSRWGIRGMKVSSSDE